MYQARYDNARARRKLKREAGIVPDASQVAQWYVADELGGDMPATYRADRNLCGSRWRDCHVAGALSLHPC